MMQQNTDQINSLNTMLSDEQTRLYNQYYQMESAISQLQTNMSIVNTFSMLNSDGSFNGHLRAQQRQRLGQQPVRHHQRPGCGPSPGR